MPLGIEDYGSGSDDSDTEAAPSPALWAPAPTAKSSLFSKLPAPTKSSSLSLPSPSTPVSGSSSGPSSNTSKPSAGLALSAPKNKRPKKIAIGLPTLSKADSVDDDSDREQAPAAKRPRLEAGAGASSLLAMLPAPKQKAPVLPAPQRVLGGGQGQGLVFGAPRAPVPAAEAPAEDDADDGGEEYEAAAAKVKSSAAAAAAAQKAPAGLMRPASLAKGRVNVNVEDTGASSSRAPARSVSSAPAVDFFSLGSSSSPASLPSSSKLTPRPPSAPSLLPTLSSAPKVEEYTPPEPTPTDPYPGYYQLPSGTWAAYDTAYYQSFHTRWQRAYDKHVRALEKGAARGFEDYEEDGAHEVNAAKEMERAKVEVKEREERKALTSGAGAATGEAARPNMNIQGAKLGRSARTRHQLTTLLAEAYNNREALEEQIAQGRRNRKEAGHKYGF